MPTVTRSRVVAAPAEGVWRVVANPERLAEWWPGVQRVEEATPQTWTTVVAPPRGGRSLRADYTLVASEHPRRIAWRHEVEESPFARILISSETEIELEPLDDGRTAVRLSERLGLRGLSRLGGMQVRRATRRKLDGALAGLEGLLGRGDAG